MSVAAATVPQAGTLRTGDIVACGATMGKVRSLNNSAGRPVSEAGPSIAVQLIGLNAVPQAGDEFQAFSNESDARKAADAAQEGLRAARIAEMSTTGSMVTLSSLATFDEDTDTLQVRLHSSVVISCCKMNSGSAVSFCVCAADTLQVRGLFIS
jgi:translation initiation factor IF-2